MVMERMKVAKSILPRFHMFRHHALNLYRKLHCCGSFPADRPIQRGNGRSRRRTDCKVDVPPLVIHRYSVVDLRDNLAATSTFCEGLAVFQQISHNSLTNGVAVAVRTWVVEAVGQVLHKNVRTVHGSSVGER